MLFRVSDFGGSGGKLVEAVLPDGWFISRRDTFRNWPACKQRASCRGIQPKKADNLAQWTIV
jgi:hypothetical protein